MWLKKGGEIMAVKKKTTIEKAEIYQEKPMVSTVGNKTMTVAMVLLLLGGIAHMLPEQMAPVLKWSLYGVSFQLVVGVLSVILALNYLLEE